MATLEDQVDDLYADSDVQRMLSLSGTASPLRICYPREVNVSRFLAWLLDPTQGHGLGDLGIRSLLARAGQTERAQLLPQNDRRFLSPSNVYTQSFSSMIVTTEVDVGVKAKKLLDVLLVDPAARLYIAIENKFGAKEGKDQTKQYHQGLKRLFPSFRGIHVFLDSQEAEPKDQAWLPVGYDWLAEYLKSCEQRESTAEHVRHALAQFRSVVEDEDEDSAVSTPLGALISHVGGKHREVLAAMKGVVSPHARSQRAKELAAVLGDGVATNMAKAQMRLLQLYCRRPSLWDQCFRQSLFGPFKKVLSERFGDLVVDPRRVVMTFSLDDWNRLVDKDGKDEWWFIAGVRVRAVDEQYNVISYVEFADVKPDKREALLAFANEVRAQNGLRAGREDNGWLALRRVKGLSSARAVEEALEQLLALKGGLERIR